ncbi:MAG: hypothetical protein AB7U75_02185 [Hyphomicrobiaceae bacterium]
MNAVEREVIILNSAWEMIDDMVNWAMFVKTDRIELTNLIFESSVHARLFAILLGDFLSEVRAFKGADVPFGLLSAPSNASPTDLTFLFHLRQVCSEPKLGSDTTSLSASIEAFANWLECKFTAPNVNLPAINVVAELNVARYRYIKMCGDIAKHNLARLATNVRHLRRLLKEAGHTVDEQEAYLAIVDFFAWFHGNIFFCHSSKIAEFLNEIRWSIYEYLQPEFARSWYLTDEATKNFAAYSYLVPTEIEEPLAIAMYWDVMNRSRTKPYMQRFVITGSNRY